MAMRRGEKRRFFSLVIVARLAVLDSLMRLESC